MSTSCFVVACLALPVTEFQGQPCCSGHGQLFHRLEKRGLKLRDPAEPGCRIAGCEDEVKSRGLCIKHYQWAQTNNVLDTLAPKAAPRTEKGEPGPKPRKAAATKPVSKASKPAPAAAEPPVAPAEPLWMEPFISSVPLTVAVSPVDGGAVEVFHAITEDAHPDEKVFTTAELAPCRDEVAATPPAELGDPGLCATFGELHHLATSRETEDGRPLTVDEIADVLSAISWRALARIGAAMQFEDIPPRVVEQTLAGLVESHYAPELDGDLPDLVGQLVARALQAQPCAAD